MNASNGTTRRNTAPGSTGRIQLGVLASQCLDRRIPNKQAIIDEVAAWVEKRNTHRAVADWRFTTKDARVKLKSLYPFTLNESDH